MSFVYERDNTQAAGELRHQSDGDEKKLNFEFLIAINLR